MKKERVEKKEVTAADALHLLRESGQTEPSPERVRITFSILKTCVEREVEFSGWEQPLFPALNYDDIELIMEIEEDLDIKFDDDDPGWSTNHTFGDLIRFVETYVVARESRIAREKARLAGANCSTQAAFYTVRRRLLESGAAYYRVHGLRPDLRLLDVPAKHAEMLADGLGKDYEVDFPLRRVLWNRVDTGMVLWAFFWLSVAACFFVAPYLPLTFLSGILLCILMNVSFNRLVGRHSRFEWPKEYQTLGDVARKIAATVPPAGAMQAAS